MRSQKNQKREESRVNKRRRQQQRGVLCCVARLWCKILYIYDMHKKYDRKKNTKYMIYKIKKIKKMKKMKNIRFSPCDLKLYKKCFS